SRSSWRGAGGSGSCTTSLHGGCARRCSDGRSRSSSTCPTDARTAPPPDAASGAVSGPATVVATGCDSDHHAWVVAFPPELTPFVAAAEDAGAIGLIATALALGFRHGFDWDHLAAITDVTSTTTTAEAAE